MHMETVRIIVLYLKRVLPEKSDPVNEARTTCIFISNPFRIGDLINI